VGNHLTSSMIEVLTPIWEQILQRSPIGLEDNFFDLGGDSFLAVSLFNEIARVSGRELPPVMIYQASTIAALVPPSITAVPCPHLWTTTRFRRCTTGTN